MSSSFEIAQNRVEELDAVMRRHREAMDCCDCEEFLLLGIQAFYWIERYMQQRSAEMAENPGDSARLYAKIRKLYEDWLPPCDFAIGWADSHRRNDYVIKHYEAFRHCFDRAKAFLAAADFESLQDELELSDESAAAIRSMLGR